MGRPKGVQNKFTLTLKEAILASFTKVGGIDYLERQARENPQAYLALLAKVLPMQVTGPNDGPIMVVTGVVRAGDHVVDVEHEPVPACPYPALETKTDEPYQEDPPDQDDPDPPAEMRAVARTRAGFRFVDVPPPAPATHEGCTVTTDAGQRVRTVQPLEQG